MEEEIDSKKIFRYAFIDVLNTASTAQNMLGFLVDWSKLCSYLKIDKGCNDVFLYTGIENGDLETAKEFDTVSKSGNIVRSKSIFAYKNKDKIIPIKCAVCQSEVVEVIDMGYTRKSNCDVELSVDAIERSASNMEMYIFTGDGDFEYLILKSLEKGVGKIFVVSFADKCVKAGVTISRFSTKLRRLIAQNRDKVFYISLLDIKDKIRKDTIV